MRWHRSPVISKYYPYWYSKSDFSSQYITLYLLLSFKSMIYSLVQERDHFNHSKRTWFPFILMISDQNKVSLKYEPGCFPDLHFIVYLLQIISDFKTILLLIKKKWLFFTLSLLLSFESCTKDSANSWVWEWIKLPFQMITFS